jgi:polyisoprenoid-binding protein YceI
MLRLPTLWRLIMKRIIISLTTLLLIICGTAIADVYVVDSDHAEIGFSVKHMVITNVKGAFREYTAGFEIDGTGTLKSFTADIKVESIDTRIKKRDDHLRSPEFFDVARFPTITFRSTSIVPSSGNTYQVTGVLQIRDVARKITLEGKLNGPVKDPWGNQRMGISLMGKIDRRVFGLTYNKVLETGALLIDNEINIHLEGEGILTPN